MLHFLTLPLLISHIIKMKTWFCYIIIIGQISSEHILQQQDQLQELAKLANLIDKMSRLHNNICFIMV